MTFQQLRVFLAVYEEKTLVRAAERVCLTSSALSKCIKELESDIGFQLFDRSHFGLMPNFYGRAFARHALEIMDEVASVKKLMNDLRVEAHPSIEIAATSLTTVLPPFIQSCRQLTKSNPAVQLVIHELPTWQAAGTIAKGELPFAIMDNAGTYPENIKVHRLGPIYWSNNSVNLNSLINLDKASSMNAKERSCAFRTPDALLDRFTDAKGDSDENHAGSGDSNLVVLPKKHVRGLIARDDQVNISSEEVFSVEVGLISRRDAKLSGSASLLYEAIVDEFSSWNMT